MPAKKNNSFRKKNIKKFFIHLPAFLVLAFSPEIRADVLILKNGKRIKADHVRMKNGNRVEIRIGKEVQTMDFSKVESILPEFSSKKEPKKEKISKVTPTSNPPPTVATEQQIPASVPPPNTEQKIPDSPPKDEKPILSESINATSAPSPEIPKRSRWVPFQALIPGWSPLLLADDRKVQITGGIIALSELYVLYRGLEFFLKPERYYEEPGKPSHEAFTTWALVTAFPNNSFTSSVAFVYFHVNAPHFVVTQRGNVMEDEEFNKQRSFYGVALFSVLALDFILSSTTDLTAGSIKSVRLSTSDGGRTSMIGITWVF